MIFYFSATGNSRFAAFSLGESLGEKVYDMIGEASGETGFSGDTLGFVFPVYSWGIPVPVSDFIKKLGNVFAESVRNRDVYVWAVITCGDDVALAPEMFIRAMSDVGIKVASVWNLEMPNTYVLLPGFDVDPKKLEDEKIRKSPERLGLIATQIKERTRRVDVVRGGFSWIKTRMIYPLFRKWGIQTRKWRASSGCIGCGKCSLICPYHNITMKSLDEGERPEWGKRCCSCLGCYHVCPRKAVQYGGATKHKGQYRRFLR